MNRWRAETFFPARLICALLFLLPLIVACLMIDKAEIQQFVSHRAWEEHTYALIALIWFVPRRRYDAQQRKRFPLTAAASVTISLLN